jgi:outer membrane cobalamin receptor
MDSAGVVTQLDLNWTGHRSIGDVLETLPGTILLNQGSEGQYNQFTMRGQDWRSVAVTMNGRPINDPASGIYNLFYFSPEYADRVEVITGPRAFLYGLSGTGATVNLVTKNFGNNKPFTKIDYEEDGYGYSLADGTYSQNVSRRLNLSLGFQSQNTDGRYSNSLHQAWNIRGKLRYNLTPQLAVLLSEYYTNTFTNLNGGVDLSRTGSGLTFDPLRAVLKNTDSYEKVNRHDLDVSFVGTLFGDSASVSMLTLYYSNSFREYRDEENRQTPNGIFVRSDHASSWSGVRLTQDFDTRYFRLSLGWSSELRQIEGSPNLGRRRDVTSGIWGKNDFLLGEMLTVSGFGRYDHYLGSDYLGGGGDARLSLFRDVTLFGGFSFARRVPNYLELYWADQTFTRSSELKAEGHRVFESGLEVRPGSGNMIRLAFFHRAVENPILMLPGPALSVFPGANIVNGNRVTTSGIEAGLTYRVWYLMFEGSAMYLIQHEGESMLSRYAKLSARGGAYFRADILGGKLDLKAGFRGRYSSPFSGEVFNPEAIVYITNAGQLVGMSSSVDFLLIAHIGDAYIHFAWENFASVQYFGTPYYPAQDRGIRFGIKWEFLN